MFYLIGESLEEADREQIKNSNRQYVAVLSSEEWEANRDSFEMGIDLDTDISEIYTTKAEVNYDSLTGSFSIPNR
nr:magnesium transporter CorA [Lachnospiraceae bacterium]